VDLLYNLCNKSKACIKFSGGARVFAAQGKRLCCRPGQSDRQLIFLWLQRTMALVWTVTNNTLSWRCNYVMQIPAESVLNANAPVRRKRPNFRIPYFRPLKCRPLPSAARGRMPTYAPPLPAATEFAASWRKGGLTTVPIVPRHWAPVATAPVWMHFGIGAGVWYCAISLL